MLRKPFSERLFEESKPYLLESGLYKKEGSYAHAKRHPKNYVLRGIFRLSDFELWTRIKKFRSKLRIFKHIEVDDLMAFWNGITLRPILSGLTVPLKLKILMVYLDFVFF